MFNHFIPLRVRGVAVTEPTWQQLKAEYTLKSKLTQSYDFFFFFLKWPATYHLEIDCIFNHIMSEAAGVCLRDNSHTGTVVVEFRVKFVTQCFAKSAYSEL